VVASANYYTESVGIHVVIECKQSAHAWITRTTPKPPAKGRLAWLPIASASVLAHLESTRRRLEDNLVLGAPTEFDVISTHSKGDTNPAYDALSQVVSAAVGLKSSTAQSPNAAIFHPVVVLDGSLFRADLSKRAGAAAGLGDELREPGFISSRSTHRQACWGLGC
jgi:hypothetical protein